MAAAFNDSAYCRPWKKRPKRHARFARNKTYIAALVVLTGLAIHPGCGTEASRIDGAPNANPNNGPGANDPGSAGADPSGTGGGSGVFGSGTPGSAGGNLPPTVANPSFTTPEDTAVQLTLTASDPEGADLTFSVTSAPAHGTLGPIDNSSLTSATVTYTPAQDYHGVDTFVFEARDPSEAGTPATAYVTINPVNDAPVALAQIFIAQASAANNLTLGGADADGDSLTYQVLTPPAHGTLSGAAPRLTYTPATGYTGGDSLAFIANDGQANSAPAQVSISVNLASVNTPPLVASPAAATTAEDTPATVTLNGSDVNNDNLTFSIVTPPAHGTLGALNNAPQASATTVYTPAANFAGADSFTFKANDGTTDSNLGTFTITVSAVNDVPSIVQGADVYLAVPVNSLSTAATNRTNLSATDPDAVGSSLTWSVSVNAQHGTAAIVGANQTASGGNVLFSYQPANGYSGPDSFSARVSDGLGGVATTVVHLSVGGNTVAGSISRVAFGGGTQAVSGLSLALTGTGGSAGVNMTVSTDAGGNYSVFVPAGWSGSVAASSPVDWNLVPAGFSISNVASDQLGRNFTASCNYYVATTGSDANPGSSAQPYLTVQTGINAAKPGDNVILRAGTYSGPSGYQTAYVNGVRATAAAPITIKAQQQGDGSYDTVVIDGNAKTRPWGMRVANSSYIVIDGLTFQQHQQAGLAVGRGFPDGTDTHNAPADNVVVRNCLSQFNGLTNTWPGGFEVSGPTHDVTFDRCESHDNGRGFYFGESHQTNMNVLPYRITVLYCYAHHNTLYANNSDGFTTSGARNVLLSHCVSHDNSADGITEQGPYANDNTWEYCVSYNGNAARAPLGDGNGFKICNINGVLLSQGYHGGTNHVIRYCVSFNNINRGFEDTEGAVNSVYYNNIAFGNEYWGFLTEGVGATFRNNLGSQNAFKSGAGGYDHRYQGIYGDAAFFGPKIASADYNFWADLAGVSTFVNSHKTSSDNLVIEPHTLAGNPLLVNPASVTVDTNLYAGNPAMHVPNPTFGVVTGLQLQSGSPCIDAGAFLAATAAAGSSATQVSLSATSPMLPDPTQLFRVGDLLHVQGASTATVMTLTAPVASPASPGLIGLSLPVTFNSGAGVHLNTWNGLRPDIGPFESP